MTQPIDKAFKKVQQKFLKLSEGEADEALTWAKRIQTDNPNLSQGEALEEGMNFTTKGQDKFKLPVEYPNAGEPFSAKTKAAAIGVPVVGAGAAALYTTDLDSFKDAPIKDKVKAAVDKDEEQATKAIEAPSSVAQSVKTFLKSANPSKAAEYPMPGAYRAFQFNRTDFSKDLEKDLKEIGGKYDKELKNVDDKSVADESRIQFKKVMKDLVDAAALLYLAKHSPMTEYTTGDQQREMEAELGRLDKLVQQRRSLVGAKFKELQNQIKDKYATAERGEDKAENTKYRDFSSRQQYEGRVDAARRDMFKMHQAKELANAKLTAKKGSGGVGGDKEQKLLARQKRLKTFEAEQSNKSQLKDLIEDAANDRVDVDTMVARLKAMGANDKEIKNFTEHDSSIIDWSQDVEDIVDKIQPDFAHTLAERQVENIFGGGSNTLPTESSPLDIIESLQGLNTQDEAARDWLLKNPTAPQAEAVFNKLHSKYGK